MLQETKNGSTEKSYLAIKIDQLLDSYESLQPRRLFSYRVKYSKRTEIAEYNVPLRQRHRIRKILKHKLQHSGWA